MTGMSDMAWKAAANAGAHVTLAVPIEMQMRHGTPPIQKALDLGMSLSLSTDVECTMTADMFTQMRGVITLQRMFANELALQGKDYPKLMSVRDAVRLATIGGAKGLKIDGKTGSLTPGKDADIILLDATALNVAPLNHAAGAVVTLMDRSNVSTVLCAGRSRSGAAPFSGMTFPSSDGSLRQAATMSSPRRESRGTCSERKGSNPRRSEEGRSGALPNSCARRCLDRSFLRPGGLCSRGTLEASPFWTGRSSLFVPWSRNRPARETCLAIELFRQSGRAAGLFVSVRRRRSSRGFQIDLRLCQLAEQGIGLPLFLKCLVEKRRGIFHAELRRPSLQRAVARHFVVLDGLAASE